MYVYFDNLPATENGAQWECSHGFDTPAFISTKIVDLGNVDYKLKKK